MKLSTSLGCLLLVSGCALDWLAQVTPIVAKIRIKTYETQSDGTEVVTGNRSGYFYRSSAGDSMKTDFAVDSNGNKRESGKSHYVKVANGQKRIYLLNHNSRNGGLRQQLAYTPWRPVDTDHPNVIGRATIAGLRCIAFPIEDSSGNIVGKTWWALDVDDLLVKTEHIRGNKRRVNELYDIQFTEPEPSKFGFASDYVIDETQCRGCE